MKVAILLNRDRPRLRTLGKQLLSRGYELVRGRGTAAGGVLPEFDAFAQLLDPAPLVLGTESPVDWRALAACDLLLWEWGWTEAAPALIAEVRRRTDVPLLLFPGSLDRFWREVEPASLPAHFAALGATDAIGAMLRDTIGVYAALAPAAHVFHMPVPVDTEHYGAIATDPAARSEDLVLLTAPTRFYGPASQLSITTYLAFRRLVAEWPRLEGITICYDDEERRQAEAVLRELGLSARVQVRQFVRPIGRFLDLARWCRLGLALPHGLVQGRLALMAACLRLPMVTSDDVETHRALFPQTTVRWHDVDGAVAAARRLLEADAFAAAVATHAWEAVDYYSVARARGRLEAALAVIRERRALREGA